MHDLNLERPEDVISSFRKDDPLFPIVRDRLEHNPTKKEKIKDLFSKSLPAHKAEIVAVRSEDVLTILQILLDGKIQVDVPRQSDSIRFKARGYYYVNPVELNPYYQDHPELIRRNYIPSSFNEAIAENTGVYAANSAFATAFSRNVLPVFKEGWREKVRSMKKLYESETTDIASFGDDEVNEWFIGEISREIKAARKRGIPNNLLGSYRHSFYLLNNLSQLLKKGEDAGEVVDFLQKVIDEREGVVIGFNPNVFQGQVVSANQRYVVKDVIHADDDLAIKPDSGEIDLSVDPIVAIESLGIYEDSVLEKLGLL